MAVTLESTNPGAPALDEGSAERPRRFVPRREVRMAVETFAVCGLVVGEGVLGAFGAAPEHFSFLGITRVQIIAFAVLVLIVPTIVVVIVDFGLRQLLPRRQRLVHSAVLGVLVWLGAVRLGWQVFDLSGLLLAGLAGIGGVVFAYGFFRAEPIRLWTRYASVIPVMSLLSFLIASPVSAIVFPSGTDTAAVSVDDPPPIVMLVLDELPTTTLLDADGHIDRQLFPAFAELADNSTWYRNANSVSNATVWAVPAILTGQIPAEDSAPLAADHPRNLFALLGDNYDIRADEGPLRLCPPGSCEAIEGPSGAFGRLIADAASVWWTQVSFTDPGSQTFALIEADTPAPSGDGEDPSATQGRGMFDFMEDRSELFDIVIGAPDRFESFLESIGPSPDPTLDYLHILLPHEPWRFYPSGLQYDLPRGGPSHGEEGGVWVSDPATVVGRQRHILQAQYADRLLDRLMERLRDQGTFDETLIVVVADHGVAFETGHSMRARGDASFPDEVVDQWWAPLFIKQPLQSAGILSDQPAQSIDIVPTLLDILDVDPDWPMDGTALSDLGRGPRDRTLCYFNQVSPGDDVFECRESADDGGTGVLVERGVGQFLPEEVDEWRVYRAGPFGEIVGRPTADLLATPSPPDVAVVTGLDSFEDVDPSAGTVPGLVSAQLEGQGAGVDVAVAVNGVIATTTTTFDVGDETGIITAIIPDFVFEPGANELTLQRIVDSSTGVELSPISLGG